MERNQFCSTEEKKYECPQCYGSGIYGIFIYDPIHSEDYIEDKCDMCGGTGKLDRNEYSQVMEPPDISINTNMEDIPF
jgi:DnaJ-class molecular chaperone